MTSGTLAAIAALNGREVGAQWARRRGSWPSRWSVLTVAPPRPGKCLAVGCDAARPASRSTAALASRVATRAGSRENSRPPIAAPSTRRHVGDRRERDVDPARRAAPARPPWRRGPGTCPACAAAGGAQRHVADHAALLVGADDRRRAARPAGLAQRRRQRAQLLRRGDVVLEQDRARTPSRCAGPCARSVGAVVPLKRSTTSLPTCCWSESASTGAGAAVGVAPGAAVAPGRLRGRGGATAAERSSPPAAPNDAPRAKAAPAAASTAARRRRTTVAVGTGYMMVGRTDAPVRFHSRYFSRRHAPHGR